MKTLSVLFSSVWLTVTAAAVGASDAFWTSLPGTITAICSGLAVLLTGLGVFFSRLAAARAAKALLVAEQAKADIKQVDDKVTAVAVEVDGKLEKMVALTRDKYHAEGVKEATDKAKDEKAASDSGELKAMKEQQLKDQPPVEK